MKMKTKNQIIYHPYHQPSFYQEIYALDPELKSTYLSAIPFYSKSRSYHEKKIHLKFYMFSVIIVSYITSSVTKSSEYFALNTVTWLLLQPFLQHRQKINLTWPPPVAPIFRCVLDWPWVAGCPFIPQRRITPWIPRSILWYEKKFF